MCVRCRPFSLHPRFVPRDGARLTHSRLGGHAAGDGGSASGPRACLPVVMGDPSGSFKGFGDRAPAFSCLNILRRELKGAADLGHIPSRTFCPFLRGKRLVYSYGEEEMIWLACLHCGILKALSLLMVLRVCPQLRERQSDEKTDSLEPQGWGLEYQLTRLLRPALGCAKSPLFWSPRLGKG